MERVRAACAVRAAKLLTTLAGRRIKLLRTREATLNLGLKRHRWQPLPSCWPLLSAESALSFTHPTDRPLVCILSSTANPAHGVDRWCVHIYSRIDNGICFQSFLVHSFWHSVCLITYITNLDLLLFWNAACTHEDSRVCAANSNVQNAQQSVSGLHYLSFPSASSWCCIVYVPTFELLIRYFCSKPCNVWFLHSCRDHWMGPFQSAKLQTVSNTLG